MTGVHDQIIVYGAMSGPYQEALRPMWDSGGRIVRMDSLATMGVRAPEETYGFALEDAFPAIMMAHS